MRGRAKRGGVMYIRAALDRPITLLGSQVAPPPYPDLSSFTEYCCATCDCVRTSCCCRTAQVVLAGLGSSSAAGEAKWPGEDMEGTTDGVMHAGSGRGVLDLALGMVPDRMASISLIIAVGGSSRWLQVGSPLSCYQCLGDIFGYQASHEVPQLRSVTE